MALQQLVGDGASCSGGNALKGLASQMDRDRSLIDEHRRMNQFDPRLDGAGPSNALEEEFLRSTFGDPHNASVDRLSNRLAGMPLGGMQARPPPPPGSWADEFAMERLMQTHAPFESHFEEAFRHGEMERVWAGQTHHPVALAEMEAMERAYSEASRAVVPGALPTERVQAENWASEYERDQASAWVEEFTAQEKANNPAQDADQISSIAGRLIDSVSDPKMQQSKFMDFMRQLRDRKVTISDNKVVETNSGSEWVSEFAVHNAADPAGEWADAFASSSSSASIGGPSLRGDWASEFAREEARNLDAAAHTSSWASDFDQQYRNVAGPAAAVAAAAQAHALNNGTPVAQISSKDARLADWVQQYRQNIEPLRDETWEQWDKADKPWERYKFSGFGYEGFGREMYSTYVPQKENPHMDAPAPYQMGVDAFREHRTVDAILALEAEVHRNPENAAAWLLLGRAQAENENDVLAVAALQKATAADPQALEGWIDLAASYSNENCRVEAFKALHTWLSRHPRYGSQPFMSALDTNGHMHNQLVQQFVAAARLDATNMDPDVQVALGLLFNMSSEYAKATDCFAAALQGRPDDYALWNRLGACQSKSGRDEESIGSYHRALSINPAFVRARVNLGLSCISLGVFDQAAEHMLTALVIQGSGSGHSSAPATSPVWDTLLHAVNLMNRPDLTEKILSRNLPALLGVFNIHA